jgi:hypothetical protein
VLYFLGGAPRSGKSTVARKLLLEHHLPYFPTDCLMMGLRNGMPELNLPSGDPHATGERLWPVVRAMAMSLHWTGEKYLLEGDLLLPAYVAMLRTDLGGQLRACWLGYADIDVGEKVGQLCSLPSGPNDWITRMNRPAIHQLVTRMRGYSIDLRSACVEHDFPYYDGSVDFHSAVECAFDYLSGV